MLGARTKIIAQVEQLKNLSSRAQGTFWNQNFKSISKHFKARLQFEKPFKNWNYGPLKRNSNLQIINTQMDKQLR